MTEATMDQTEQVSMPMVMSVLMPWMRGESCYQGELGKGESLREAETMLLCPITLHVTFAGQTSASSKPVTSPVTPPALVPTFRTHQPLKHCYHSFTLTPEIPGI